MSFVKACVDGRERESNLKLRKEDDRVKGSYNFRYEYKQATDGVFVTLRVWWIQFYWTFFVTLIRVAFLKEHLSVERFRTQNCFSSPDWTVDVLPGNLISLLQFFLRMHSYEFWWRVRSSSNLQTERSAFAMLVNLEWSTQQVWKYRRSTIKCEFKTICSGTMYCTASWKALFSQIMTYDRFCFRPRD